jgi:fucokinase
MFRAREPWDYLVLTAANQTQAKAYETQIDFRRRLGQLAQVKHVLVVPDLDGKRIGSGGSTIECLRQILERELPSFPGGATPRDVLSSLRILIVHAGGDSRRLPAYSPGGKIFVPLPGESFSSLGSSLFDRLYEVFRGLPAGKRGAGQTVIAAGDALFLFDPTTLDLSGDGITVIGTHTSSEEAARHGVFCANADGTVRLVLQKPPLAEQIAAGALNRHGQAVLDVGLMSMDANASVQLLEAFCAISSDGKSVEWKAEMERAVRANGVDLYREISCALGTASNMEHYLHAVRGSGSKQDESVLSGLFESLRKIPANLQMLRHFTFLHFGTTRQLIASGISLSTHDNKAVPATTVLGLNNDIQQDGSITGNHAWVEGCRIAAPLKLTRDNVVVGIEISAPLSLPEGACLDVSQGVDRLGAEVWFVRCYGMDDSFKDAKSTFCGVPLADWLSAVGAASSDIWPENLPQAERTLWTARLFPAEKSRGNYRRWLWMVDAASASAEQKREFLAADRYSAEELLARVDQKAFHEWRSKIRAAEIERSLASIFRLESTFSSTDLAFVLKNSAEPARLVSRVLGSAHEQMAVNDAPSLDDFNFSRMTHCLASAIEELATDDRITLEQLFPGFTKTLPQELKARLDSVSLSTSGEETARKWAAQLRELSFHQIHESIVRTTVRKCSLPRNMLRPDETIWGRCPARIELAGGWTDTPPYTLEYGGEVINTAININGQPPIHCYCRITDAPVIRLNSIDSGSRLEITELAELLDYHRPGDSFALAKAALAISGFAPEMADWPSDITLPEMLRQFGGGIEITTLVGIPQGSGLGTSSILGAVILAVIGKLIGRTMSQQQLFHDVLRLEQALTTGGGWQDQVGGCVGGTKITSTRPGMIPDASIHYVPSDVLDPKLNGGCTLLYYTGLTRVAKNILQQIVGGYLNRNQRVTSALGDEYLVAEDVADTMSRKDIASFGICVDAAWALQKRLCGTVTNAAIDSLLHRVRPFVHGMRISGAGSGGFLLMVCKSPEDAKQVRRLLEADPLNERSRFFDFEVNNVGLEVTTC